MSDNYFFFDGSALLGDIKRLRRTDTRFAAHKLHLTRLVNYFAGIDLAHFHSRSYRRAVFYFVKDDDRLRSFLELPDFTLPGTVNDIRIEYCGKRIAQFDKAREWLEQHKAPESVAECLYRSEKAVDTQICCDALQLAAVGKLDRLFLYTNDFDFVPLVRALRHLGVNANLVRLSAENVNKELVQECDGFNTVPEWGLKDCFGINDEPQPTPG